MAFTTPITTPQPPASLQGRSDGTGRNTPYMVNEREQLLLTPVPLSTLLQLFRAVVQEVLEQSKSGEEEKLLTAQELCALLAISRTTLHYWLKQGRLPQYRIGKRLYFKKSEVLAEMKTLKKYRRNG